MPPHVRLLPAEPSASLAGPGREQAHALITHTPAEADSCCDTFLPIDTSYSRRDQRRVLAALFCPGRTQENTGRGRPFNMGTPRSLSVRRLAVGDLVESPLRGGRVPLPPFQEVGRLPWDHRRRMHANGEFRQESEPAASIADQRERRPEDGVRVAEDRLAARNIDEYPLVDESVHGLL